MNKALVSVIIPYRERPAPGLNHIDEAIEHIIANGDIVGEIIVVNNNTKEFVPDNNDPRIRVINIYSKIWNSAWARNIGLKQAKYKYFANIDADVIIPPDYFAMGTNQIKDAPSCPTAKIRWAKDKNWEQVLNAPWKDKNSILNVGTRDDAKGLIILQTKHAISIKGYNEILCGWGGADNEFIARLNKIGVSHSFMEQTYSPVHLPHGHWSGIIQGLKHKKANYNDTKIWGDPNSTWWIA